MPTVGSFHTKFWKARANIPPPPGTATGWMYPGVQSVVTMHMALWGPPLDVLSAIWARLLWWLRLGRRLWALSPLQRDGLLAALERLEAGRPVAVKAPVARDVVPEWGRRLEQLTADQRAVLERVASTVESPAWDDALARVAACSTTPKFHQPEQWVEYGRAIKKDRGQAQNVYRHVRVVHELKAAYPDLTNPEAHLLTELAYHARALRGRQGRRVIEHAHL